MSVFKRANWHSGLTYRQTCESCNTEVTYKDDKLGFRPWFPDGFVYCPTCEKPLRHNEAYAIDGVVEKKVVDLTNEESKTEQVEPAVVEEKEVAEFCTECGGKFREGDKFCSQCGKKR